MRIAMGIEYDGTSYVGWQFQHNGLSVQQVLEEALAKVADQPARTICAGRTDTGVHALGQVVHFDTDAERTDRAWVFGCNTHLPKDVAVKVAYEIRDDFNVRRDVLSREYRYYILNNDTRSPLSERFTLFIPKELDIEAMNEACCVIQGEHDFVSFGSSLYGINNTVRNIYEANIKRRGDFIVFRIVANSFLPHQIRNTIGLLIRLGLGKIRIGDFHDIMTARSPGLAGPAAPSCGLCLTRINYAQPLGELT